MAGIDTAKMRQAYLTDRIGSHWDGCAYGPHYRCAIARLCDALDAAEGEAARMLAERDAAMQSWATCSIERERLQEALDGR